MFNSREIGKRVVWVGSKTLPATRRACRGASAIEFALVFPVFFTIFYGIVSYGLILAAQQSLTLAAEEGGRAALKYQPAASQTAALTARAAAACQSAQSIIGWLPKSYLAGGCVSVVAPCDYDGTLQCIKVTLNYNYAQNPLVPPLPLLGVILPSNLVGVATVQLNPVTILSG
ncbi:pilus assembly protein [Crenobacter sp. SG2305]|uniref:TadE/TadG family type IV pilus assembly protein n=1 Tax=Crenobacter oryzisoli TaxID=3056844 RepID=UPI0025AB23F0|nr:TadE family protein [Crenobacter sp. SG2305]MDN0085049.1 pilus assembly protein [Crenobacter sp. SG2305]